MVSVGLSFLRDHLSAGCIFVGTHWALIVQCLSFSITAICLSMLLRNGDDCVYHLMNAFLAGRQSVSQRMGVGVFGGVCWSALRNASVSRPGMDLLFCAAPVQCHQLACAVLWWWLYITEPPPVKLASVANHVR